MAAVERGGPHEGRGTAAPVDDGRRGRGPRQSLPAPVLPVLLVEPEDPDDDALLPEEVDVDPPDDPPVEPLEVLSPPLPPDDGFAPPVLDDPAA